MCKTRTVRTPCDRGFLEGTSKAFRPTTSDKRPTTVSKTKAGYPGRNSGSRPASSFNFSESLFLVARSCVRRCSSRCRSRSSRSGRIVPCQPRIERRHFKRHLVARRGDGHRCGLHHFRFVVPRVDLHASAQGQRRDLSSLLLSRAGPCDSRADRRLMVPPSASGLPKCVVSRAFN